MKRKLSEREAWLALAKAHDNCTEDGRATVLGSDYDYGVCILLRWMFDRGAISLLVYESMDSKIDKSMQRYKRYAYAWSLDAAGAKQRAAFCRRKAAKLSRKKKTA